MAQKLETAPSRAWRDTKKWLLGSFIAWTIVLAVSAVVAAIFSPITDTIWARAIAGLIGAIVALIIIVGITYLVHLLIAPYRQRDEARTQLSLEPKPTPLDNRRALLTAIYEVKEAATEFIEYKENLREALKQNPDILDKDIKWVDDFGKKKGRYEKSLAAVNMEEFLAGDDYKIHISPFILLIQSGILVRDKNAMLKFKKALDINLEGVRKKIDEISASALKKNSKNLTGGNNDKTENNQA